MSTQLEAAGIRLHEGYDAESLPADIDMYIVGNAISRGNPQFEYILNHNLPYRSAPQWLYEQVLCNRWVLAVAGTHGKTTSTAMLAWILEYSGMNPGFLIGGMTKNFEQSARLGDSPFFVIEADEYDTALFDKRSKFVHYHPRTLLLNNLEFDHADIFNNLADIQRQFHHLVRMMPSNGLIIHNTDCEALNEVLDMGCWSERLAFGEAEAASGFSVRQDNRLIDNDGAQGEFKGVKLRLEHIGTESGIKVFDDFAHHPTAIELTLNALRDQTRGKLFAVLDIRSNTMKMGNHAHQLQQALSAADVVLLCENKGLKWDIHAIKSSESTLIDIKSDVDQLIQQIVLDGRPGDTVAIMSNGGFENIHQRLIQALQSRQEYAG